MRRPDARKLDAETLVDDFGSRSAMARGLHLKDKNRSPNALRLALESYYGAVVALVVERMLGEPARWEAGKLDLDERWLDTAREQLARYDTRVLADAPPRAIDHFGPLYQDLFPRYLRHALGEYYTPDWLAEHVLDSVDYRGTDRLRLLDPTCGSGVFLLAAIRRIRAAADGSLRPEELGRHILNHVTGFDVNRLAVLTARANYLLAIRDLLPSDGPPCPAPPVRLRDVILDASEPDERFDTIVGNPPWVAWDNLADEYRERTKPLWQQYGLFSLTGNQARHGGGKKDLSMLVLYRAADRYLRDGGRLGFVITQTLFQTKGAGDGFRRFRLGEKGEPLCVTRVDDMAQFQPFAGASNWTATIALEKGRETDYPIRYVKWRQADAASEQVSGRFFQSECSARPIDPTHSRSPWILLPAAMTRDVSDLMGPSDYTGHLGANSGGANGVYWVDVVGPVNSPRSSRYDCVMVRNLAGVGKRIVEQVEAPLEAKLLYPLVRWSDLRRWRAEPRGHLLLAQDAHTRSGIDEATMRERWPAAMEYLTRFRSLLERRAAYRRYQSAGPFWSMYNVGPYTLAPVKVVWRRMDRRINAAVVEPLDDPVLGERPVIVQETCVQVSVGSTDEAHYLAAMLNSLPANFLVAAHSVNGGKGFGTPSMLDYLRIRRFDSTDTRHCELGALSREAHRLAEQDQGALAREAAGCCPVVEPLQRQIDLLAGQLWGLSGQEVAEIEGTMRR